MVNKLPTNCLSLFDNFVELALKRLRGKGLEYFPTLDQIDPLKNIIQIRLT